MCDNNMPRGKQVSDERLLDVIRKTDDPVLTAVEIADDVGLTRQAVASRLNELEEDGEVQRKKPNRDVFYWLP